MTPSDAGAIQDPVTVEIPGAGPVTLPAGFRPKDIPSLDMSHTEMAGRILSLEYLVKRLYRAIGIDPDYMEGV